MTPTTFAASRCLCPSRWKCIAGAAVFRFRPPARTMRITGDPGGMVLDYVGRLEATRASGEPVIIDGACLSASYRRAHTKARCADWRWHGLRRMGGLARRIGNLLANPPMHDLGASRDEGSAAAPHRLRGLLEG
jgi:hypothetical protein